MNLTTSYIGHLLELERGHTSMHEPPEIAGGEDASVRRPPLDWYL